MKNYWQILGLEEGASQDEIKKAYKKYAKKFHPDLHGNDEFFKERFQEIQEAYETLSLQQEVENKYSNDNSFSQRPEIIYFTSSDYKVKVDDIVTLSWRVLNADSIYIEGLGNLDSQGSKKIRIRNFRNGKCCFDLIASNSKYSISRNIQILQLKQEVTVKIQYFSISTLEYFQSQDTHSAVVYEGGYIYLFWHVDGAGKVICPYINKESFPLVFNAQPVQILFGDSDYVDIFIHAYDNRGNIVSQNVRVYNKKSEIRGAGKYRFFDLVFITISSVSLIYIIYCIFDSLG